LRGKLCSKKNALRENTTPPRLILLLRNKIRVHPFASEGDYSACLLFYASTGAEQSAVHNVARKAEGYQALAAQLYAQPIAQLIAELALP
jgi:hypothetical protein